MIVRNRVVRKTAPFPQQDLDPREIHNLCDRPQLPDNVSLILQFCTSITCNSSVDILSRMGWKTLFSYFPYKIQYTISPKQLHNIENVFVRVTPGAAIWLQAISRMSQRHSFQLFLQLYFLHYDMTVYVQNCIIIFLNFHLKREIKMIIFEGNSFFDFFR